MTPPCKNCEKRRAATREAPSCHADCEVYAAWKKMLDAARADQNKGSIATGMIVDTVEKIRRNNHRKRRR